jgi:hypothetical protein
MPPFRFEFAGNAIHLQKLQAPTDHKFPLLANEVELIRNAENSVASVTILACLLRQDGYNIHNYYNHCMDILQNQAFAQGPFP